MVHQIGNRDVGVDQLAIGLVGNEVDGVSVLGGLLPQKLAQSHDRLLGVDHAAGVVGRVDDKCLGVFRDLALQIGNVDLDAVNKYAELKTRYDYLNEQITDLEKRALMERRAINRSMLRKVDPAALILSED